MTADRPDGVEFLTLGAGSLGELVPRGSHVCWVVDDASDYCAAAEGLLAAGREAGEKLFVFGPSGDSDLTRLGKGAGVADPAKDFLGGGALDPEKMFAMFRSQHEAARQEGFAGLRVVADMEWLLPTNATPEDAMKFELLLDRVIRELGATVICAYRTRSFDAEALRELAAVHPVLAGCEEPEFRIVAGPGGWVLSGEVDFFTAARLASAFDAASGRDECVVDVSSLGFIDVAGMRVIAKACAQAGGRIRLAGVSPLLRRCWTLAQLDRVAPLVEV